MPILSRSVQINRWGSHRGGRKRNACYICVRRYLDDAKRDDGFDGSFGWTKNYDKPYSEADYVADGAEITMTAPVELTAITLKIAADNKVKIRLLPTEVGGYTLSRKRDLFTIT